MIVGSVLPVTRADKQKVMGLTALPVPTTMSGSSDPMYPKPLDARTTFWIASPVKGEVYHSTVSAPHSLDDPLGF